MMIYREEFDKPDLPGLKGTAEIIVAKQRDGPTGSIPFKFESRFTRFTEVREEESH
jgi:replicative DNA helicase